MLYLHCGWARTSTSSFQTAMYEHRDRLLDAHILYPEKWTGPLVRAHHGLYGLKRRTDGPLEEFRHFLEANAGFSVILSAEGISGWILSEAGRNRFLEVLVTAHEVLPVKCLWTLRRFDDALESLYLLILQHGGTPPPPEEYFKASQIHEQLFEGMRRVAEVSDTEAGYLKYDRNGRHNRELLAMCSVPDQVGAKIWTDLERGPRQNVSLLEKEATTLVFADELSAKVGAPLDRDRVLAAFRSGRFRFLEDRRCELMGRDMRLTIHEQALATAEKHGVHAYPEFFAEAEVPAPSSSGLDPDMIETDELARLSSVIDDEQIVSAG